MHLSIFNFNKILKIFILFIIFSTVYNIYIVVTNPKITMFQNQWQKNYSFAQEFIYGKKATNIVVGSSMAARMDKSLFPDNYFNLSFSGGSSLTGLEIIKRSGYIPKYIYIETNVIFRNKDIKMISNLFYPVWWKIKKFVPSLQEKYQPLNLILSKLKGSYGKSHKEKMLKQRNNKIFNISMKNKKRNYRTSLKNYSKKLDDLKKLVNYFEKKGTVVVFFEMPIDNSLSLSIKSLEQRNIIKNNFKNNWLPFPNNNNYITTDGIHLLYSSAYKFTQAFIKEAENFKNTNRQIKSY